MDIRNTVTSKDIQKNGSFTYTRESLSVNIVACAMLSCVFVLGFSTAVLTHSTWLHFIGGVLMGVVLAVFGFSLIEVSKYYQARRR